MDYVKQLVVPKEVVKASFEGQKAINLTLMTFDKNVHKIIVPVQPQKVTPLMMYDIDKVLVFIWYDNNEKIIQINGEIENENVTFILPDELRGYPGIFYMEVDLVLTDDRTMTLAQFRAETKASNADMIPENVIKEAKEWYFQLFEDWAGDVGSAKEDAEKDWLEWKKQREQDWKTFENNFTAWKTAQEKKQTDFQTSVNTKHTAIDTEITALDKRVKDTNTALGKLDAYTKTEVDTKLNGKANTADLDKKAAKTEVEAISKQLPSFVKGGERVFATPLSEFANYHDESNEANSTVWLQYIIQGHIGLIFGAVKNTRDWSNNEGGQRVFSFPENIKVITGFKGTGKSGSTKNSFEVSVYGSDDKNNPNSIVISQFKDENQNHIEAKAGTRFDIFAAFLVE